MLRRFVSLAFVLAFAASVAADTSTNRLLLNAWPGEQTKKVSEIGRGIGVVFSPDLSVKDNCHFYEALGFACFQDADWTNILAGVHTFNLLNPDRRIGTLILETHGTNGNGLKVQAGYEPDSPRSYISVGALQERLEADGVFHVVISACNSGRLLRPAIYNRLDPYCGDKLFLPPTNGIVNAADDFDPRLSAVMLIRPQSSHIETTLVGTVAELRPSTRRALAAAAKLRGVALPKEFAVSDMLVQMLTRDPYLQLVTGAHTDDLSAEIRSQQTSEQLFTKFVTHLNRVALRERPAAAKKTMVAKKRVPAKPSSKSASAAPRR
ncbi:MAG: hypothetical protein AABO58_01165 [Acidobacteriota bacterium]